MLPNEFIWWNGRLVPWTDARVHVTSETALRGLNVFEGIRAYWRPRESSFAVVGMEAHLERLAKSAHLLAMPTHNPQPRFRDAIAKVVRAVPQPGDLYIRPTIYVDRGGYELDPSKIKLGEFVSWRREPSRLLRTLRCNISSWMRIPPACLPPGAKIGATYTAFRMARLEAIASGYDEAILLNDSGRVSETGGGSMFIVKGETVRTPPLDEGILPSITRRIVLEALCSALSIEAEERPLTVADLHQADEAFIAGTLDEISRIASIGQTILPDVGPNSVVRKIQTIYRGLCQGTELRDAGWIQQIDVGGQGCAG